LDIAKFAAQCNIVWLAAFKIGRPACECPDHNYCIENDPTGPVGSQANKELKLNGN
jgi:hypothetical protein